MTIDYKITDKDFIDFNVYHNLNTESLKRRINLYKLMLPIIYLVLVMVFYIAKLDEITLFFFAVIGAVAMLYRLAFYNKILARSITSQLKKAKKYDNLPYCPGGTLTFKDGFVNDVSIVGENKLPYCSLNQISLGKTATYIYYGSSQAFIIPHSTFDNLEDREYFIGFVNSLMEIR